MLGLTIGPNNDLWKQLQSWLAGFGWETLQVAGCAIGRKELDQNPQVDLLVVDADSADECGLKLIGFMKNDPRLKRIPIIVAGASINQELAIKYAELGVDNILLLPTDKDTFDAKVGKADLAGKPRILIVDDEELIRELLFDFLTLERYSPILASNVDEALQILETQAVDAVVTDIMMPGKTGLDLLIEIKHNYAHIPVIMITGLSQRYSPKDIIAMGADGYFAKPFHNLELTYTLRKILSGRPRRPQPSSGMPVSQAK